MARHRARLFHGRPRIPREGRGAAAPAPTHGGGGHGKALGRGGGRSGTPTSTAALALALTGSARQQQGSADVSAWTQTINETGASFANWTALSGTWASDGTIIQQTNAATATQQFARLDTKLGVPFVATFDFRIPTAGAITGQTDEHVGIVVGVQTNQGNNPIVRAEANTQVGTSIDIELNALTGRVSIANAWTYFDTWHTIKAVWFGGVLYAYFDGTFIGTAGNVNQYIANDSSHLGLLTVNVKADFRNIKAWMLDVSSLV